MIFKKIISLALSLCLAAGTAINAFAEDGQTSEQELPTIEIRLDEGEEEEPEQTGTSTTTTAPEEDVTAYSEETAATEPEQTTTTTAAASASTTTTTKTTTARTTTTTKRTTTTTKVTTAAPKTVRLTQSIVLYKGETKKLDIVGKGKPTVATSNKKIVAVSGMNITAKKSGSAKVTVTVKNARNTYIVTINVRVKVSSYDSSVSYKTTSSPASLSTSALVWHKALKAGNSFTLKMSGYDKVTFTSSNTSVAGVTSKGVVTGKKKGTALIKAKVKAGTQSYTFYTKIHVYTEKTAPVITQTQINEFFGASGFIGSSIGVGQQMYFNSQGYSFLGHPAMMVRGCYAFHNDGGANGSQYQIGYGGYTGPARYVVQRSGVKRVFINMGTNDMVGNADYVFNNYVSYISGIRAVNPNVPIYIEAMTPVYSGGQRGNLTNANVNALNAKLAAYCKKQKDIYFIDINTPLKADTGALPLAYSSDRYVHLTFAAYKVWTDKLVEYVKAQMIAEQRAKDAVKTYTESGLSEDLETAKKYVKKLEASSLKTSLEKKLKK